MTQTFSTAIVLKTISTMHFYTAALHMSAIHLHYKILTTMPEQ